MGVALRKPEEPPLKDDSLPVPYDEEHAAFLDAVLGSNLDFFSQDEPSEDDQETTMAELAEATCLYNTYATVTDIKIRDQDRKAEIAERLSTLEDMEETDALAKARAQLEERQEGGFPSTMTFQVSFEDEQPDYVPGQYFRITYEDYEPRVYSAASSPNQEELEFCIRRVPGGKLTEPLFAELEEGDELFVRGPYLDELLLNDPSDRDVVFLATGTGAAPFKSMIDYLFEEDMDEHNGEERNVWLFLGSRYEDTIPYREEFEELGAEQENFYPVLTASRESQLDPNYGGPEDYIQQEFARYLDTENLEDSALAALPDTLEEYAEEEPDQYDARIDPENLEVYACGIDAIKRSTEPLRDALGIDVQEELFG